MSEKWFCLRYGESRAFATEMAQPVKSLPAMWETWVWSLDQEDPMQKEMATHPSILGNIPWVFCNSHAMDILENPMDGGSWRATVHEVAKSQTQPSDFTHSQMQVMQRKRVKKSLQLYCLKKWKHKFVISKMRKCTKGIDFERVSEVYLSC